MDLTTLIAFLDDDSILLDDSGRFWLADELAILFVIDFERRQHLNQPLQDPFLQQYEFAQQTLAMLENHTVTEITDQLCQYLIAQEEPYASIVWALGKSGDSSILPILDSILLTADSQQDDVVYQIIIALTNFEHPPLQGLQHISDTATGIIKHAADKYLAQ